MVWLNYGLEGAIHVPTLYDAVFVDAILMRLRVGSCVERVKRRDTGEIMYEEERERERGLPGDVTMTRLEATK